VRKRRTNEQIEELARSVQLKLWEHRRELFGDTDDPIEVLNPARVLELAGYKVQYHEGGLGHDVQDGVGVDVAGLIDPANKVVEISLLSSPAERIFTLAHELGHVMLGSTGTVVHRDRPLNGTRITRDASEREADRFAACFLMPSKLLRKAFLRRFLTECFELNDATAFALRAARADSVRREFPTLRALSCYLANAEHYNGGGFPSLASAFNVSPVAMAIRLEELALVRVDG
jgi:Zn-dependent peptidase ImmA (M78 family)